MHRVHIYISILLSVKRLLSLGDNTLLRLRVLSQPLNAGWLFSLNWAESLNWLSCLSHLIPLYGRSYVLLLIVCPHRVKLFSKADLISLSSQSAVSQFSLQLFNLPLVVFLKVVGPLPLLLNDCLESASVRFKLAYLLLPTLEQALHLDVIPFMITQCSLQLVVLSHYRNHVKLNAFESPLDGLELSRERLYLVLSEPNQYLITDSPLPSLLHLLLKCDPILVAPINLHLEGLLGLPHVPHIPFYGLTVPLGLIDLFFLVPHPRLRLPHAIHGLLEILLEAQLLRLVAAELALHRL